MFTRDIKEKIAESGIRVVLKLASANSFANVRPWYLNTQNTVILNVYPVKDLV